MLRKVFKSLIGMCFVGMLALPAAAGEKAPVKAGFAAAGTVTCYDTSRQENEAAVKATNLTRRQHGLQPLRANDELALAAARHACDMARRGVMSHQGSTTRGPMQRVKKVGYKPVMTAENIAFGPWGQDRVLMEWARSQGHLKNILMPKMRHYGIGKAVSADGRMVYWAAVYGAPKGR